MQGIQLTRRQALLTPMPYWRKVLSTQAPNLIAYWPLNEPSGLIAHNLVSRSGAGVYSAVSLGQAGPGNGDLCPSWNGSTSFCNIYSAAFDALINGDEGTLLMWVKAASAAVWTDNTARNLFSIADTAGNNSFVLWKYSDNVTYVEHHAGGVSLQRAITIALTDWFQIGMTWSKTANQKITYLNAAPQGAVQAMSGTWADGLNNTKFCIGAATTVPIRVWNGQIAHVALWNAALTPGQVNSLYQRWN